MIIDAQKINEWGHRYDAKNGLPSLLRMLFISSTDLSTYEVQTGNQIFCSGWDGVTFSPNGTSHIPQGKSIWEMGTETNFRKKFSSDNTKRLSQLNADAVNFSFCFATPYLWTDYAQFENDINSDPGRGWNKVKIHCASSLANWIEEQPWVKSYFCKTYGLAGEIDHVHMLCEEYESCTRLLGRGVGALDKLIISERNSTAEKLYRWIESDKKNLRIEAASFNEIRHFTAVIAKKIFPRTWDYWGTKIILIDDACSCFNFSHLSKNNILVASPSQYRNLCMYQERSGCRIIIVASRDDFSSPQDQDILELENMSNDIILQELQYLLNELGLALKYLTNEFAPTRQFFEAQCNLLSDVFLSPQSVDSPLLGGK